MISEFYKYSSFADLAYVEWDDDNLNGDNAVYASIKAKRAPGKLAEKIFLDKKEKYSVLSYYANEDSDTGFKASLYGNESEKILSICGTEPPGIDLLKADFQDIGSFGVSINQAVCMYNYIMRLTADTSTDVQQLAWNEYYVLTNPLPANGKYIRTKIQKNVFYVLEETASVKGLGQYLSEGDKISLTGHSLGGHLAAFAQRLFP
jgi:hypothetical protein